MEEAAEVIAQAQAEEAVALLAAAAAQAEAARAVADSQRIQSAAAAAVRALITAGLVEEAAAHEAVTVLTAAGLIVAAADQAAADAVAEDIATIEAADEVAAESVAESLVSVAAADEIADEATSKAGARVRAASITMAEAQVLRYLPTSLPFAVIAGARHLPVRGQGASGTPVPQARRPQPGRGGQPGPLPGPHPRPLIRARTDCPVLELLFSRACGPLPPRYRPASPRKHPRQSGSRATPARRRRSRQDDYQTGAAPRTRGTSSRTGRSRYLAAGRGRPGRRTAAEHQSGFGPAHPRSGGAVPGDARPACRVAPRYFSTSALISSCGMAGTPGSGGRGRPVTVWTISASPPPGSSMS